MRDYYVYIMANMHRTIYIGVTNSLERRVHEHKHKLFRGFTQKYGLTELVYFEVFSDIRDAIGREKELKGWRREKKVSLIETMNPKWVDLSADWYEDHSQVGIPTQEGSAFLNYGSLLRRDATQT